MCGLHATARDWIRLQHADPCKPVIAKVLREEGHDRSSWPAPRGRRCRAVGRTHDRRTCRAHHRRLPIGCGTECFVPDHTASGYVDARSPACDRPGNGGGGSLRHHLAHSVARSGTGRPGKSRTYLIFSHYHSLADAAVAPGADDNASGVAGLLAIAPVLAGYQLAPVQFAALTGEEVDFQRARAFVKRAAETGTSRRRTRWTTWTCMVCSAARQWY